MGARSTRIHASLAGCDKIFPTRPVNNGLLKSTHPLRDATPEILDHCIMFVAKIHASLAGCDQIRNGSLNIAKAKIHASLAGCDFKAGYSLGRDIAKIHASLAGCDINVIRALEN